jgi:hypothetical protein
VHVMVAWEIKAAEAARRAEISSALKEALKGYSWVRAVGNVYIVKVRSEDDRRNLGNGLKDVAREFGEVNIIYSPAMEGGRYNGWLPRDLWQKIRQRVDDV